MSFSNTPNADLYVWCVSIVILATSGHSSLILVVVGILIKLTDKIVVVSNCITFAAIMAMDNKTFALVHQALFNVGVYRHNIMSHVDSFLDRHLIARCDKGLLPGTVTVILRTEDGIEETHEIGFKGPPELCFNYEPKDRQHMTHDEYCGRNITPTKLEQ